MNIRLNRPTTKKTLSSFVLLKFMHLKQSALFNRCGTNIMNRKYEKIHLFFTVLKNCKYCLNNTTLICRQK